MPAESLAVSDFTAAVAPVLEHMDRYHRDPSTGKVQLYLSDVRDKLGKQYVDLVQEGGGVHGIALAGYTYILEKMGVSFTKMAGTSAGSINTLLLNAVLTKDELHELKKNSHSSTLPSGDWNKQLQYDPSMLQEEDYYETRSEKLVECLAGKDLRDLVDGEATWKKILLGIFRGQVDFTGVTRYFGKIFFRAKLLVAAIVLLMLTSLVLAIRNLISPGWFWMIFASGLIAAVLFSAAWYLVRQGMFLRKLYRLCERFGINPGKDFEQWLQTILEQNGVHSISNLKSKLQLEKESLLPAYVYVPASAGGMPPATELGWDRKLQTLAAEILVLTDQAIGNEEELGICQDEIRLLYFKLSELAKYIPEEDRLHRADRLLDLYYRVMSKENWIRENCEPGKDVKSSVDKEIALVCSDISNGIKVEFPAMHKMYWAEDYSISPAQYVRGSMSVPFFFKPFEIGLKPDPQARMKEEWKTLLNIDKQFGPRPEPALLVDGGLLSNFPVNIFYNPDMPVPGKPTIGVKLEFEDESRSAEIASLPSFAGRMVNTMRFFYDRDFISRHSIFRKTVRSIDTGKVHWLNFALTPEDQVELFFRGALTAAIFLLSSTPSRDVKTARKELAALGSSVPFRGKPIDIYARTEKPVFQTEDEGAEDLSFYWPSYKRARLLHLSDTRLRNAKLKTKASFAAQPSKEQDKALV